MVRSCGLRRCSPSAGETAQLLCRLCAIRMERRFTDCTFAEAMTKIRDEGGLKLQDLLELLQPETFTVGEDGNFAVRTPVLAAPKLVSRSVAAGMGKVLVYRMRYFSARHQSARAWLCIGARVCACARFLECVRVIARSRVACVCLCAFVRGRACRARLCTCFRVHVCACVCANPRRSTRPMSWSSAGRSRICCASSMLGRMTS